MQAFEGLEKLMRVEPVAKHIMAFAVPLCPVAVEVLAYVCELLYWLAAFEEPTSHNFGLDAKCGFIQHK